MAYLATYQGREYRNPTLVLKTRQRVRIELVNQLDQPTIVQTYMFHCHNLEHEDGGMMLGVKVA